MLYSPEGGEIECMIHLNFPTTNNEVEYEVLVARLDLTNAVGATNVIVYCDSQVVTSQVNGEEMSRRVVGQIHLGSQGRERESQSPCQSRLSGTHAYP